MIEFVASLISVISLLILLVVAGAVVVRDPGRVISFGNELTIFTARPIFIMSLIGVLTPLVIMVFRRRRNA